MTGRAPILLTKEADVSTDATSAVDSLPVHLRDLDPAWIQHCLRGAGLDGVEVTDVRAEPMAIAGAMADMARLRLGYARVVDGAPPTLIAKIRAADEQRQALDLAMGLFAREAHFYAGFASSIPARSPRCYGVGDGSTTPLLLEDLADLRIGDQVAGLRVSDAEHALAALAALHAQYWEDLPADREWLASPTDPAFAGAIVQMVTSGAAELGARYRERVPDGVAAIERLAPHWGEVLTRCAEGPQTLIHNDCRVDNIFFDGASPVFVDWQVPAVSRGVQDVGNLLAGSMDITDLREHWERLVRHYHAHLVDHGVRGYGVDECLEHYRQTILYPVGQGMALLGVLDRGDDRGLAEAAVLRPLLHCTDLDSFSTVRP